MNSHLKRLERLENQEAGATQFQIWFRCGDRMLCEDPPADLSLRQFAELVPRPFTFTLDRPDNRRPYYAS